MYLHTSVGGAWETYGSCHVCLSVRVILQHTFLRDRSNVSNEVAIQLQLSILPPQNWLDFCFWLCCLVTA